MKYVVIVILLLLVPGVHAWKWDTHQNIIEYVYINLPLEVQQKLNLTKLKDGAVIPDRDFKDHKLHHYPFTLTEAQKWLSNDSDLSLNLGIASHYITDSYVAPHNIFGENYKDHSAFESQVSDYYPNVACKDYGLTLNDLHKATKNSEDWKPWLRSRDKSIPEREVDEATRMLFSIILKKLNTTCLEKTQIAEVSYITKEKIIISFLVLIIGSYFLKS